MADATEVGKCPSCDWFLDRGRRLVELPDRIACSGCVGLDEALSAMGSRLKPHSIRFESEELAPGGGQWVIRRTKEIFRGEAMEIPPGFRVVSISVGRDEQPKNKWPIAAAETTMDISILVQNVSTELARFDAVMEGSAVVEHLTPQFAQVKRKAHD